MTSVRLTAAALLLTAGVATAAPSGPEPATTTAPSASERDPALARQVIGMAADQVRNCYRSPRVPRGARQIITVLRVRYAPDGMLLGPPEVVRQSAVDDANLPFAGAMARAAAEAVMRCTPLRLPPDLHSNGWDEFELTFSPRGLA